MSVCLPVQHEFCFILSSVLCCTVRFQKWLRAGKRCSILPARVNIKRSSHGETPGCYNDALRGVLRLDCWLYASRRDSSDTHSRRADLAVWSVVKAESSCWVSRRYVFSQCLINRPPHLRERQKQAGSSGGRVHLSETCGSRSGEQMWEFSWVHHAPPHLMQPPPYMNLFPLSGNQTLQSYRLVHSIKLKCFQWGTVDHKSLNRWRQQDQWVMSIEGTMFLFKAELLTWEWACVGVWDLDWLTPPPLVPNRK